MKLIPLRNVENAYRPLPFWSLNEKLDPKTIREQAILTTKSGSGGFFLHARGGLQTPYMGEEWMECMEAGVLAAKEAGAEAWLYDEEGWPSGFAAGAVTALGDAMHGRWLVMQRFATKEEADRAAAEQENVLCVREIGQETLVIAHRSNPYYIDVMSHDAVAAFLSETHEKYYERLKPYLGKELFGFFTDEPRLSGSIEGDVPWSYALPNAFFRRYGYDMIPELPSLFLPLPGHEKIRFDFWQLVSSLFVDAFMRQIHDWCKAHNCQLTGHMMMEESIFTQMTGTAGVMPFYSHMDVPGIDWLRRRIDSPVVPRQLSSVAHQLGIRQTLTESFALTGWNVRPEELKWILDWQLVNGVTRLCQHLQGYSLRGLRKRDYPPSLFYQLSWFEELSLLNDTFARVGKLLTVCDRRVGTLLLHPMHSGWVLYGGGQNPEIARLDDDFTAVSEWLSARQIDYDYGDETLLAQYGSVEGKSFRVGKAVYDTVILPSMRCLDESTYTLLREFVRNGGRLISAGEKPTLIEGRKDDRLHTLWPHLCPLDALPLPSYSILEEGAPCTDVHSILVAKDGIEYLYIVNHSTTDAHRVALETRNTSGMHMLDLVTGEWRGICVTSAGSRQRLELLLSPMQSCLLALYGKPESAHALASAPDTGCSVVLDGQWKIADMEENAWTLDACAYSIDGGPWQPKKAVIHLFDELLALQRPCSIAMRFAFMADKAAAALSRLDLAVEQAEAFDIRVNGTKVTPAQGAWYRDKSFARVPIGGLLHEGENEILLSREFSQPDHVYHVLFAENVYETELNKLTYDTELESIYLVGDFALKTDEAFTPGGNHSLWHSGCFTMTKRPDACGLDNLTTQGFPYFSGRVTLEKTFEAPEGPVWLSLDTPDAAVVHVAVNGEAADTILFAPYTVDLTPYAKPGENTLALTLVSGNRNLLGPHHHIDGEVTSVGPQSFTGRWSWVEKKSEANPSTEEQRSMSYWNDAYAFVPFGVRGKILLGNGEGK